MKPDAFDRNGWECEPRRITAPCGCVASGNITYTPPGVRGVHPDFGKLTFEYIEDCGKTDGCVFQEKSRALTFHGEIPYDSEVWEWYMGKVSHKVVQ